MFSEKQIFVVNVTWATVAVAALIFWPIGWMGFTTSKILVLHLGIGLSCLLLYRDKIEMRRLPFYLALSYFSLNILYTLLSPAPLSSLFGVSESAQGLLTQLIYFSCFLLALKIKDSEEGFKWILRANALIIFYTLLQVAGLDPLARAWEMEAFLGRAFSTLGNPAWLGVWLLLTFPLVLGLKKRKWLWISIQGVALILTGSKAAMIGLIVFALGMMLVRKQERKKLMLALVTAGLGFLVFLFQLYPDSALLLRSLEARGVIWRNSVEMIKEQPEGYGLEMFSYFHPQFTGPELWQHEAFGARVEHPHNQLLELWLGVGPLGVLLFYAFIFAVLIPRLKDPMAWGVLAALTAQLFGFETVATGALMWLFLGILSKGNEKKLSLKLLMLLLGIANLLALGLWLNHQDRVKVLESSYQLLEQDEFSESEVSKILDWGERFSGGRDADTVLLQALMAARLGEEQKARDLYQMAKEKDPYGPRTYYLGMEIFRLIGDLAGQDRSRAELCSLLPTFWNKGSSEQGRIFQKNNPWVLSLCGKLKTDPEKNQR